MLPPLAPRESIGQSVSKRTHGRSYGITNFYLSILPSAFHEIGETKCYTTSFWSALTGRFHSHEIRTMALDSLSLASPCISDPTCLQSTNIQRFVLPLLPIADILAMASTLPNGNQAGAINAANLKCQEPRFWVNRILCRWGFQR